MFGGVNESDLLCDVYNSLQTGAVWSIVDADVRKVTFKVSFGRIIETKSSTCYLVALSEFF